ncbi:MAG: hypothetical protein KAT04_13145 [Methylococcales bacterium]|nr:hypothetical protein [Methylococcales bacterium]
MLKNPMHLVIGFLLLFSVTACQFQKTPVETTLAFWSAIAEHDIELAKDYCSASSLQQLSSARPTDFKSIVFNDGKIVINGNQASVEADIIYSDNRKSSFTTFLVKENEQWKVDYARSSAYFSGSKLFNNIFKSLSDIGESFNEQLEQQVPLIEKEVEQFGEELKQQIPLIEKKVEQFGEKLKQQIDDLGNELKKSYPQNQQPSSPDKSI